MLIKQIRKVEQKAAKWFNEDAMVATRNTIYIQL